MWHDGVQGRPDDWRRVGDGGRRGHIGEGVKVRLCPVPLRRPDCEELRDRRDVVLDIVALDRLLLRLLAGVVER